MSDLLPPTETVTYTAACPTCGQLTLWTGSYHQTEERGHSVVAHRIACLCDAPLAA
jgi:hypothetical protein